MGKVVEILNIEVKEGLKERVTVEQRSQEGQRMKPYGYLKEKHFRQKEQQVKRI